MALRHHKENELGGYLTMGRSIGLGVLVSLVMAVIGIIWLFVFFNFVEPDALDVIRENEIEKAIESGRATREQMEEAGGIMDFFISPTFFSIMALIFTVVIGLITSAIAGAVMKKEPPMI